MVKTLFCQPLFSAVFCKGLFFPNYLKNKFFWHEWVKKYNRVVFIVQKDLFIHHYASFIFEKVELAIKKWLIAIDPLVALWIMMPRNWILKHFCNLSNLLPGWYFLINLAAAHLNMSFFTTAVIHRAFASYHILESNNSNSK